jgi:hypothetical protein
MTLLLGLASDEQQHLRMCCARGKGQEGSATHARAAIRMPRSHHAAPPTTPNPTCQDPMHTFEGPGCGECSSLQPMVVGSRRTEGSCPTTQASGSSSAGIKTGGGGGDVRKSACMQSVLFPPPPQVWLQSLQLSLDMLPGASVHALTRGVEGRRGGKTRACAAHPPHARDRCTPRATTLLLRRASALVAPLDAWLVICRDQGRGGGASGRVHACRSDLFAPACASPSSLKAPVPPALPRHAAGRICACADTGRRGQGVRSPPTSCS